LQCGNPHTHDGPVEALWHRWLTWFLSPNGHQRNRLDRWEAVFTLCNA
jgi:hypothetical protein